MRRDEKEIRNYIKGIKELKISEEKEKKAVQAAKEAFYEGEQKRSLSSFEFLYEQSRYIQKRWWILQAAVLMGLWWFLVYTESGEYVKKGMGMAASLFAVLIMPELWKNRNTGAMEIEGTTFYTLRQVYAARLMAFALADGFLLGIFFAAASFSGRLTLWEAVVQFFIPFNISCCICFGTLYSRKTGSEVFSVFLCMIWDAVWLLFLLQKQIYEAVTEPVWAVIFISSVLYLFYCIGRGQKKWRQIWEGQMLWS